MDLKASEMIISYRGLSKAMGRGLEEVHASSPARLTGEEAVKEAVVVASIEHATSELAAAERDPRTGGGPRVFLSLDSRSASLLQSFLANEAAQGRGQKVAQDSGGYEAQFDTLDGIGWGLSLRSWWRGYLDKHAYIAPPEKPVRIDDNARVAMLGDWGTNLYGAPYCANAIAAKKFDVVLHLGDVYYAGTESEVEERFVTVWPKVQGAINRALNGNHEMYSGGNAYFRQILPRFDQSSSNFALENSKWMLLGVDSAYEGNDWVGGKLSEDQVAWMKRMVDLALAGNKRVIMLSHHQPFSLFELQGQALAECIEPVLTAKSVFAWYWGHEHRCVIYDRHPMWEMLGRCVGHSGFPYFRDKFGGPVVSRNPDGSCWYSVPSVHGAPGGQVLDGPNAYINGHQQDYGPNGWLSLEFSGPHLNEIVHAADGTALYQKTIA